MNSSMKITKNTLFVLILTVLCILKNAKADIPVHCHLDQVIGEWRFTIDKETFTPSLKDEKTTCGHGFPNHIVTSVKSDVEYFFSGYSSIIITLTRDMKVYEKGSVVGSFTMIYDEGFIVYYKDSIFTAHMKYYKSGEGKDDFTSVCSKTMKGWLIKDKSKPDENWSCFFGAKTETEIKKVTFFQSFLKKVPVKMLEDLKAKNKEEDIHVKVENETPLFMKKEIVKKLEDQVYELQTDVVEELNTLGLTWKAGINDNFKGKKMKDINEHPSFGIKRKHKHKPMNVTSTTTEKSVLKDLLASNTNFLEVKSKSNMRTKDAGSKAANLKTFEELQYEQATKFLNTETKDIPDSALPTLWDWRNIGGKNYVPDVRNQGDCGSCYVFASLASLESRLRIKTNNKDKTRFSRQFALSCNMYTEGCGGGYPILVGKFAHEFELVPEECMEYKPTESKTCSGYCEVDNLIRKYTVSRYEYIGGYYGATNENLMMKEILARGPIPGSMLSPWSFTYYKSGIYSDSTSNKSSSGKISKVTLFDRNLYWEEVEHSILILGWGEENGVKYWICQNSWGPSWGEEGYFRILRGSNEQHIESMGDVMQIDVKNRYN